MPVPFDEWLAEHRHGDATQEWADELAALAQAVQLTGKKGTLTIKLEVEPKGSTVVVTDHVDAKTPKFDREAAIYFVGEDGGLRRDRQARMMKRGDDGREHLVDPATGEVLDQGDEA